MLFSHFGSAMDDVVSKFIVGTCRVFSKFNTSVFDSMYSIPGETSTLYCMICGSCAEFFIQPIQPCFGNVDVFQVNHKLLAFTNEKPALPYDIRHTAYAIDCLLMEPYLAYPGFIRLRHLGLMSYNWESKAFEFIQSDVQRILKATDIEGDGISTNNGKWIKVGPAARTCFSDKISITFDCVVSIWCPQWPNEAKQWPNRRRKYGWPTTAIIQEVVQNGCHVVNAKHPSCRNNEYQCRLSFSIAEVILLQSWTKVQQIVYHMLRFFAKRELIKTDCPKEDEVLCTYHFKTLMLWSCEEISPELWNSLSVIELCCNLLKMLLKWLEDAKCPNYFISQGNLFHEHFNQNIVDETVNKLIRYYDSNILSLWFIQHYMQLDFLDVVDVKCRHDILSGGYLLQTREAMKAMYPKSLDFYFSIRFAAELEIKHYKFDEFDDCDLLKFLFRVELHATAERYNHFLPAAEYESCFSFFGSMLRLLHVVNLSNFTDTRLVDAELCLELLRVVSKKAKCIRYRHHILPRKCADDANGSNFFYLQAQDLMENLTGSRNDIEFKVVSDLSKNLLSLALEIEDSQTSTIANATQSYMAALHFDESEYQKSMDLSSRVITNEFHDDENAETLNAGCLLYIEDISNSIGFYLMFLKIRNALHYTKRQIFIDLRLTPEVFVRYLAFLSIERTVGTFGPNIFQNPAFPLDAILVAVTKHKCIRISKKRKKVFCVYQRTDPMTGLEEPTELRLPNGDTIYQLVMEYSLEYMMSFYNEIPKDFDIDCSTVDCYRAAYLYQCRKYAEVLTLCERILNEPDSRSDFQELAFANVMVLPPLTLFFDTDVQCLLGVHTLACLLLVSSEDLREREVSEISTLQKNFMQDVHSEKLSLAYVLAKPYSLKSHYFLGRHFLARYLKVRSLSDCNRSVSEVILEFQQVKASLPFEHIIRCFLQQKLRQIHKFLPSKHCYR